MAFPFESLKLIISFSLTFTAQRVISSGRLPGEVAVSDPGYLLTSSVPCFLKPTPQAGEVEDNV